MRRHELHLEVVGQNADEITAAATDAWRQYIRDPKSDLPWNTHIVTQTEHDTLTALNGDIQRSIRFFVADVVINCEVNDD